MSTIPIKFRVERRWTVRAKGYSDNHVMNASFPYTPEGKKQAEEMAQAFQASNDKEQSQQTKKK